MVGRTSTGARDGYRLCRSREPIRCSHIEGMHDWIPLDDEARGLLNSAFFWSYALLQIPAGWIVDRCGAKRSYAIGFALWTLACAAVACALDVLCFRTSRIRRNA
jgi:MFS family permease